MTRWIAAVFVVAMCLALGSAQELPFGSQRSQLPWEVTTHEGRPAWNVKGRGHVALQDLAGGLATGLSMRIGYTAATAGQLSARIPYVAPDGGVLISRDELLDFTNEILAGVNMTVVGVSVGRARVVTHEQAPMYAAYKGPDELDGVADTEWVTTTVTMQHKYGRDIFDNLGLHLRQGAQAPFVVADTFENQQITIFGEAWHVRQAVRRIADLDVPDESVRTYAVPEGQTVEGVIATLRQLFEPGSTTVTMLDGGYQVREHWQRPVQVARAGQGRVLVRANSARHALVRQALEAMR